MTWALLVGATCASWAVGSHHGVAEGARLGTAVALAVAFGKVTLIGSEFMELRTAPRALQAVFGGWVAVVGGVLLAIYLAG